MWQQLFQLDERGRKGLQAQLREALVKLILDRQLPLDVPLPSSRELAAALGVARNTVVLAYQHLVDEGYLLAHQRRGYFINPAMLEGSVEASARALQNAAPDAPDPAEFAPPPVVLDLSRQRRIERPLDWKRYRFPFIYGQVDPSLFPVNDWREAVRQSLRVDAISRWSHDQVDVDDPLLIEQILTRVLPRRGVWARPEELLVTIGAQNGLYLAARLLLDARATVGIEDPCYVDARNIFQLFTTGRIAFPVGEQGIIVDERLADCNLLYVTPSHQCPTTATMPIEARHELLEAASRHGVTILEDDYESELNFVGKPTPALKSLDQEQRVVYVGSLSKSLAPGLRVGFMVAHPKLIEQARALRRLMYRHTPANNQRTIAHFIALGHHDSTLRRISKSLKERWQVLDQALKSHAPLSSTAPAFGGSSFWVELPPKVEARRLERLADQHSIIINAGDAYFADRDGPRNYCRIGFSSIATEDIVPGIDKLASLMDEL
ncbi:MAG: 2-aminoadipate aminotransferase [Gammaproteobacteria bacterium]|nr:MAG: 2-aminoadipate aminotransferase [Gammaproteobacteria bacterium]